MRGPAWFLGITFGVAWTWWEIVIRSGVSVLSWQFQLYVLPGAFAPAVAALIVRKWITREGFADAGLRLQGRQWRYYLLAWLMPLGIVAAIVAQAVLLGIAEPDFTLARASASGLAGRTTDGLPVLGWLIVAQVMIMAVLTTPLLWGEEFGWRGYLQPRLFAGRPVPAAVATGFIWAAWHYPVTLRGYNYPDQPVLGSLLFVAIAVTTSYMFGWFKEKTGSIWAASLAHAATNSIGGLATLWFAGAAGPLVASYAGLLAVPPLLLSCFCIYWFGYRGKARGASGITTAPDDDHSVAIDGSRLS
ncbi:CPBP family intramembrane glutamic endopeptidase [Sphingosinicella sp. CPCC 101087]|uniref:CPBP family intramembrane glutamic endopeptidase n=1 Tax=Sphingosinicella sp. CPCC 101087 TaxID=2497754 RepID=UPI0013EC78BA|nr:type II CAAX endopeptidase family protein [Sphingosinicella sp. CPCC 101087]